MRYVAQAVSGLEVAQPTLNNDPNRKGSPRVAGTQHVFGGSDLIPPRVGPGMGTVLAGLQTWPDDPCGPSALQAGGCLLTCACCQALASLCLRHQGLRHLGLSGNSIGLGATQLLRQTSQASPPRTRAGGSFCKSPRARASGGVGGLLTLSSFPGALEPSLPGSANPRPRLCVVGTWAWLLWADYKLFLFFIFSPF